MTTTTACATPALAERVTKSLLGYGVIAGPLYVGVALAQAYTREGFEPTRHAWSLLQNGDLGWIQTTNLIVSGLMVIAAAVGVRRAVGRGAVPLGIYGVGMVVAGLFRADPGQGFPPGSEGGTISWHGLVHLAAGGVGFVGLAIACFLLAGRSGFPLLSRAVGVLFVASFLAMNASGGAAWGIVTFTAGVLLVSAWLTAVSVRLYRSVA
ncbi:hypothetical protein Ais01nite_55050 [Asanoa ishikariensis]|uniref:DUF998 domain-containing protein n=1 Tax=Asanoa ishikariensis TaxID=137265 RepID=A0A1H3TTV9_9ACTN|nr:DUF998 domain-containing protein [Asanoa ishikariensis]GIF67470.1 hypothetical protein Ais01nite_55050 [Asanoa ishikariensis]SDZ53586.1 Protein of unknown function [Asanoa ishikariensis]